ncbi:hypothetical protein CEXT_293971 [Caerostris extrusa]|uniref:Uncharacterized protein n=1 Tax=Caerostris extrusa TaxID=172846 RepID=A0AAV4M4E4_CAEEX|nr:hypothetical protein CEXT_293971 [Caerostris extrusa]
MPNFLCSFLEEWRLKSSLSLMPKIWHSLVFKNVWNLNIGEWNSYKLYPTFYILSPRMGNEIYTELSAKGMHSYHSCPRMPVAEKYLHYR